MMATLTKMGIIEAVCENVGGFLKRESAEVVEAFFDIIKETLERGETVKIAGFGNFVVRDKKARVGRNPQTGEELIISARRVVTFKASELLKKKMAEKPPTFGDGKDKDPGPAPGAG